MQKQAGPDVWSTNRENLICFLRPSIRNVMYRAVYLLLEVQAFSLFLHGRRFIYLLPSVKLLFIEHHSDPNQKLLLMNIDRAVIV